jgi:hypothetical protein
MQLRWYHGIALVLSLLVLGGVVVMAKDALHYQRVGFAGVNAPGHLAARYQYLDDTIDRQITVDAGEMIVLEYELHTTEGQLVLEIFSPNGERLMHMEGNDAGRAEIDAPFAGTYRLEINGDKTRGAYELHWDVVPQS